MKILAHFHGYPPDHNAGAEWMAHRIFKWLQEQGHEIKVISSDISVESFEGISLIEEYSIPFGELYPWADFIMTHLDRSGKTMNLCRRHKKPLLWLAHNTHNYGFIRVVKENIHVIYNSEWIQKKMDYPQPSLVCHPPVFIQEFTEKHNTPYKDPEKGKITLINLTGVKGGEVFHEIARSLPDYQFLGVLGDYGEQVQDFELENMEYMDNTPDIREALKKTRILLMPSTYESYGLAALEAAASRIPVICTKTKGLQESMGSAAIYCKQAKIQEWIDAIKSLDESEAYITQAKKVYKRARDLDPEAELRNLESFMLGIKWRDHRYE